MSDTVSITIEVPAEVAAQLKDVSEKSKLSWEELIIGSAEMVYKDPTQQTMKRIMRNTFARRFQTQLSNFTVRTRRYGSNSDE